MTKCSLWWHNVQEILMECPLQCPCPSDSWRPPLWAVQVNTKSSWGAFAKHLLPNSTSEATTRLILELVKTCTAVLSPVDSCYLWGRTHMCICSRAKMGTRATPRSLFSTILGREIFVSCWALNTQGELSSWPPDEGRGKLGHQSSASTQLLARPYRFSASAI